MGYFEGQVAIVTGGGSGIGQSSAVLFAKEGARVVIANRRKEKGEETVQMIHDAGGEAIFIACDIGKADQVENLVKKTVDHFGALNIAVNNASIGGPNSPVADYPMGDWEQVIQVNLIGSYYCMKYQIPALLAGGGGAICNITSILGAVGANSGLSAYVASKHGIVGLTKSAALEYAQKNIRVNAVGPAYIDTPLLDRYRDNADIWGMLNAAHPVGRMGKPEEVAELIVWLCSERASFCTGNYYPVDGGYLAQ